jgi:hypothetical protein
MGGYTRLVHRSVIEKRKNTLFGQYYYAALDKRAKNKDGCGKCLAVVFPTIDPDVGKLLINLLVTDEVADWATMSTWKQDQLAQLAERFRMPDFVVPRLVSGTIGFNTEVRALIKYFVDAFSVARELEIVQDDPVLSAFVRREWEFSRFGSRGGDGLRLLILPDMRDKIDAVADQTWWVKTAQMPEISAVKAMTEKIEEWGIVQTGTLPQVVVSDWVQSMTTMSPQQREDLATLDKPKSDHAYSSLEISDSRSTLMEESKHKHKPRSRLTILGRFTSMTSAQEEPEEKKDYVVTALTSEERRNIDTYLQTFRKEEFDKTLKALIRSRTEAFEKWMGVLPELEGLFLARTQAQRAIHSRVTADLGSRYMMNCRMHYSKNMPCPTESETLFYPFPFKVEACSTFHRQAKVAYHVHGYTVLNLGV